MISEAPPTSPKDDAAVFLAHSANATGKWHDLPEHLEAVASLARRFAEDFGSGDWGEAAGLWHDLGKHSSEFQEYLRSTAGNEKHKSDRRGSVDHSTAGAQHAARTIDILGHLLAYPIAGHHAGLPDGLAVGACLEAKLKKVVPEWRHGLKNLRTVVTPELPAFVDEAIRPGPDGRRDGFAVAFFVRMVFSCLVDADFLDTERFLAPERAAERSTWEPGILARMAEALDAYTADLEREAEREAEGTVVNVERARVREACLAAAEQPPGLFSLTVPTGGGKTLSSLSFALRHALRHGLKRVVYVIPFTSIIEQNAEVFRKVLAPLIQAGDPDPVLEHHSNVRTGEEDEGDEEDWSRLATENWDAPLVVTTSVQFYESLFANRTSRCRKLHNLSRAVVILDEVQTLPVDYLSPCLAVLRELSENYGTSFILCTATQPAIEAREGFKIGLKGIRKIIPDPESLYRNLKRVEVTDAGPLTDEDLADRLEKESRVLCIVNTRRHAKEIFRLLGPGEGHFHLSALMCPEHRRKVLDTVKSRLETERPCRVVSTQLIEAGVNIDFPVVYRSLAGLDSIAQAAGRCNRNGRLDRLGKTHLFRPVGYRSPGFVREATNMTEQVLPLHDDPMSLEAVERFFRLFYWDQEHRWDAKGILDRFPIVRNRDLPFQFDFAEVAKEFRLIEDSGRPVIVPWGEEGERLCDALRGRPEPVGSRLLRQLQRYTVQIPFRTWESEVGLSIELVHDRYPVLESPESHYDAQTGLNLENSEMQFLST